MIALEEVSKTFYYSTHRTSSMREWMIRKLRGRPTKTGREYFSLAAINLKIRAGESVALIGDNGSGKSTLLRVIAGIYPPTEGWVDCRGRLSTVFELGAGFNPQLSGLENIGISAAVLGVERRKIGEAIPGILSFAELGDSIRMPLKYYSTGMRARLAFSIAVSIQPEVLLLDEVLAVGDRSFQKKCLARIHEIHGRGATVVYVSHELQSVRDLCRRAVWLEKGKIVADGDVESVITGYVE